MQNNLELSLFITDDYIATLEIKTSKKSHQTSVRVYKNWRSIGSAAAQSQPMRIFVAGHISDDNSSHGNRLELHEIPLKHSAQCINTCNSTGHLAIGMDEFVYIYSFSSHGSFKQEKDISSYRYIKCLLRIRFMFLLQDVAICEDFIACVSDHEMQVIQLNWNEGNDCATESKGSHFRPSCDTENGASSLFLSNKETTKPKKVHFADDLSDSDDYDKPSISEGFESKFYQNGDKSYEVTWSKEEDYVQVVEHSKVTNDSPVVMSTARSLRDDIDEVIGPVEEVQFCPFAVEYTGDLVLQTHLSNFLGVDH